MLDDFFTRAVLAGVGTALIAAPLGCFVVWRRLAFFGDTLAHASLLGVAFGLLLEVQTMLSVFGVGLAVAFLLVVLQRGTQLADDALLGIIAHGSLALSVVTLALVAPGQVDLTALLFGDILAVSVTELAIIWLGGAIVLALLATQWTALFVASVDAELAQAEGLSPGRANLVFVILMAATVAVAIRTVGALLVTSLLLLPASGARQLVSGPEAMALVAALIGVAAACAGLFGSLHLDTPTGPSIVVAALGLFALCVLSSAIRARAGQRG